MAVARMDEEKRPYEKYGIRKFADQSQMLEQQEKGINPAIPKQQWGPGVYKIAGAIDNVGAQQEYLAKQLSPTFVPTRVAEAQGIPAQDKPQAAAALAAAAAEAKPTPPVEPPVPRPDEMVGQYRRALVPGGVSYAGPQGTMEGKGVGGGTYSEVPGRSVADIEADTAAVRDLRNARRAAKGERPVGERASETVVDASPSFARPSTEEIRLNRRLREAIDSGTGKDRRDALAIQGELAGSKRKAEPTGPSFGDQIDFAKLNLDTAKAEAQIEESAKANKIASMREERESALAASTLGKAEREADEARLTQLEEGPAAKFGVPASNLLSIEKGLQSKLTGVSSGTIASAVQTVLADMVSKDKLDPKNVDLAKLNEREIADLAEQYIKANMK